MVRLDTQKLRKLVVHNAYLSLCVLLLQSKLDIYDSFYTLDVLILVGMTIGKTMYLKLRKLIVLNAYLSIYVQLGQSNYDYFYTLDVLVFRHFSL